MPPMKLVSFAVRFNMQLQITEMSPWYFRKLIPPSTWLSAIVLPVEDAKDDQNFQVQYPVLELETHLLIPITIFSLLMISTRIIVLGQGMGQLMIELR